MTDTTAGLDTQKAAAAYQGVLDALASPGSASLPEVPLPIASDDVETIGRVRTDVITQKLEVPVNPAWVDTIEVDDLVAAIREELTNYRIGTERAVTVTTKAVDAPGVSREKGRSVLGH